MLLLLITEVLVIQVNFNINFIDGIPNEDKIRQDCILIFKWLLSLEGFYLVDIKLVNPKYQFSAIL